MKNYVRQKVVPDEDFVRESSHLQAVLLDKSNEIC